MPKIVVTQPLDLTSSQKAGLEKLGDVTYFETRAENADEWLSRCQGAEVICTGVFGVREKYQELHNVYISLPFVNVGWVDRHVLAQNRITISNSPGCNRYAVAEWIIGMLLMVTRRLDHYTGIEKLPFDTMPEAGLGLDGKRVTILGKGNIGSIVGDVLTAFGARPQFFRRGDDLAARIKEADIVIDTLSVNPATDDLLNVRFFSNLKPGTIFITISAGRIVNLDDMFDALDNGTLSFVIHDAQIPGDTSDPDYNRLRLHDRVFVTPHIGYNTQTSQRTANEMMIENIEAWTKGRPIRVI